MPMKKDPYKKITVWLRESSIKMADKNTKKLKTKKLLKSRSQFIGVSILIADGCIDDCITNLKTINQ